MNREELAATIERVGHIVEQPRYGVRFSAEDWAEVVSALRESGRLREVQRKIDGTHASDCAIYNAPAMPTDVCDCGAMQIDKDDQRCCHMPPDYEGCMCGNQDDLFHNGYARGWNEALEIARAALKEG